MHGHSLLISSGLFHWMLSTREPLNDAAHVRENRRIQCFVKDQTSNHTVCRHTPSADLCITPGRAWPPQTSHPCPTPGRTRGTWCRWWSSCNTKAVVSQGGRIVFVLHCASIAFSPCTKISFYHRDQFNLKVHFCRWHNVTPEPHPRFLWHEAGQGLRHRENVKWNKASRCPRETSRLVKVFSSPDD